MREKEDAKMFSLTVCGGAGDGLKLKCVCARVFVCRCVPSSRFCMASYCFAAGGRGRDSPFFLPPGSIREDT